MAVRIFRILGLPLRRLPVSAFLAANLWLARRIPYGETVIEETRAAGLDFPAKSAYL
jgi:hypothetical protein